MRSSRRVVAVLVASVALVLAACGGNAPKGDAWRVDVTVGSERYLGTLDGSNGDFALRMGPTGSLLVRTGGELYVEKFPFTNDFYAMPNGLVEADYRLPSVATVVQLTRLAKAGKVDVAPDDTAVADLLSVVTAHSYLARPKMVVSDRQLSFTSEPVDAAPDVTVRFDQREDLAKPIRVEQRDLIPSEVQQRFGVIKR